MVLFSHEQNNICSQTSQAQLDDIAHEQTIICGQLFKGSLACEQALLFGQAIEAKRASRQRERGAACFARPNRRACSQAKGSYLQVAWWAVDQ